MMSRIFAVVGPSGAGKDTLMAAAVRLQPGLMLVRRVITRPTSAGGEDFEGVTEAEFMHRKAAGQFVLDWPAHGLHYGIPKTVNDDLLAGRTVLFNCSRGALTPAAKCFQSLVVVLVTAPVPVLAARLAMRGRESAKDIAARLDRAPFQLPAAIDLRVVQNDGPLDQGITRFLAALQPESA